MADRYAQLVNTPVGKLIAKRTPLPTPVPLERYRPGTPVIEGSVLVGGAPGGRLGDSIAAVLADTGAELSDAAPHKALVFDATGIADSAQLAELHAFFHPTMRQVARCGRVVILGTSPELAGSPAEADRPARAGGLHARAREGDPPRRDRPARLRRARRRGSARLNAALPALAALRLRLRPGRADRRRRRGARARLGAAARRQGRARDGRLARHRRRDRRDARARRRARRRPRRAGARGRPEGRHGRARRLLDRRRHHRRRRAEGDRASSCATSTAASTSSSTTPASRATSTLGRMDAERWNAVIGVNLTAIERVTDALLAGDGNALLSGGGRVVCVSSISGIAGNAGQTNYATSKAGVIGVVGAYAPLLATQRSDDQRRRARLHRDADDREGPARDPRGGAADELARSRAGCPWMSPRRSPGSRAPASGGLNGNVVRVCGQSLLGA